MSSKIFPYFVFGNVVKGFGRGSKSLGIPTANLSEEVVNNLPGELDAGIYYGWVSLENQIYKMVTSIGWNPFYNNEKKSLEVHIIHSFPTDFYGKQMKLIIVGYIRPERNFNSVEELIKEIKNDIAIAENRLDEPSAISLKENKFFANNN